MDDENEDGKGREGNEGREENEKRRKKNEFCFMRREDESGFGTWKGIFCQGLIKGDLLEGIFIYFIYKI